MPKIMRFKNNKLSGSDNYIEQRDAISEKTLFFAGLAAFIVVPEAIYCSFGGPVSPAVFAIVAFSGLAWGWIKYQRQQASSNRVGAVSTLPRVRRVVDRAKKAA